MLGLSGAALCAALVGALNLPMVAVIALLAFAGLCSGAVQPARDLLVRAITPKGSMGKVFGFLSSGMGLGGAFMPLLYGWLMDKGDPRWVFYVSAIIILATVVTVGGLGRFARRRDDSDTTAARA